MDEQRFDRLSRRLAGTTSRRQALRVVAGGLAGTTVVVAGLGTATAQEAAGNRRRKNPVEDIKVNGRDRGGDRVFKGTLDIQRFQARGDQLFALGRLTGTVDKDGDKRDVSQNVSIPVERINGRSLAGASAAESAEVGAAAACDILTLVLGPLDLNLLGLRVELNQINLRITAIPGAGLLGDLLCAVVGLLSPLGALARIAGLLNDILDALDDIFG